MADQDYQEKYRRWTDYVKDEEEKRKKEEGNCDDEEEEEEEEDNNPIDPTLEKALWNQYHQELNNEKIYRDFQTWAVSHDLHGLTAFFKTQADDERNHAMRFLDFLLENKLASKRLSAVQEPTMKNTISILKLAHEREIENSKNIQKLVALSQKKKSPRTGKFLKWFEDEQVEEEEVTSQMMFMFKDAARNSMSVKDMDAMLKEQGKK
ncbi:MAG: ferritin-like domain-containing protein [Promethearchaeota archaeon]